jgi:hypothetical protein
MLKITIWTNFQIEELFTQKFFRFRFRVKKAPDPGVKKALDPERCILKKKIMWLLINAKTDNTFYQCCGSAMFIPDPFLIPDWYQRI